MRILAVASQGGGMIFGHQSDSQDGSTDNQQPAGTPANGSFIVGAQPDDRSQQVTPSTSPVTDSSDSAQPVTAQPSQLDASPLSDESGFGTVESALAPEDTPTEPQPSMLSTVDDASDDSDDTTLASGPNADLLVLKQQALSDLGPLVSQLDQTPEERFRTTMMMLQSTDNQALIKDAYAAAQAIPDEKMRAQALLDVVNEINYFTQQSTKE